MSLTSVSTDNKSTLATCHGKIPSEAERKYRYAITEYLAGQNRPPKPDSIIGSDVECVYQFHEPHPWAGHYFADEGSEVNSVL